LNDARGRLLRANRAARERFQLCERGPGDTLCATCLYQGFCSAESCLVQEAVAKRGPVQLECRQEEQGRCLEFTVLPRFDGDGEFVGSTRLVRDLSDYRRLEAQLLHAQKMESLGTLAGGVAHDFNNILTVILGTCALLQFRLGEADPVAQELCTVTEAAERAAALTRNLLTFSRRQVVNPRLVDVGRVLRQMDLFLHRLIGEHIQLVISCAKGEFTVLGDSSQLEQVFMNLVVNAKDAMPDGGMLIIYLAPVTLEPAQAEVNGCPPGRYVGITVSDTGCGMDQRTRERIFDPFFTTKGKGKGTGLGLSTVYGIVKQHGGVIHTSSEMGRGTTFRIFLPLGEQLGESAPAPGPVLRTGSGTILLAEDDAPVRQTTTSILERSGYRVIPAVDGEDAVATFKAHRGQIDLVILDVIMPRLNGRRAGEAIRSLDPEVPLLFTSGYTDALIDEQGVIAGEFHFLAKPPSVRELTDKVRELIGQAPARQPIS